jgi:5-keto-L-gluconate epimerase
MKVAYTAALTEARADRVLAWRGQPHEMFPTLAAMGYDGVELMVRGPESIDPQPVHELAMKHHLAIPIVGTGPIGLERSLSLSSPDASNRSEAVAAAQAAVRLCAAWGAMLNIGQFRGRCEPSETPAASDRFADSLRHVLAEAHRHDVRVCIEPQNRFQSSYLRTVEETLAFLDTIDDDRLGLVVDTFHMNIEERSFTAPLQAAGDRLFHVHFADNHRGAPGTGLIPFDRILDTLAAVGYDAWVSIEIAQQPTPQEAAREAIGHWRRLTASSSAKGTGA